MPLSNNATIIPMTPRRTPIACHLEGFRTKLAVDGRSKNTISAYSRDLSQVYAALESLRPTVTIAEVSPGLLGQALTDPAIVNTAGAPRSAASLHRRKTSVKSFSRE